MILVALPGVFWASYVLLWVLLLILGLLVFLLYRQHGLMLMETLAGVERDGPAVGTELEPFEALGSDGASLAWQFDSERPTLILFAAPACQPCLEVIPHIDELPERLPQAIDVVTIMSARPGDDLNGKKPRNGFFLLDPDGGVASGWGIRATPFVIVADKSGRVLAKGVCNNLSRLDDLLIRAGVASPPTREAVSVGGNRR